MSKPRIVIADSDLTYLIPLHRKFTETFLDEIELEIVTDEKYLFSMFSEIQKIDILIIDEKLYTNSLKKHNIRNTFVLTEDIKQRTGDTDVCILFRYTSIKEIFSIILGRCEDVLSKGIQSEKDTQIILITSAIGGVGKTTLALGIAQIMSYDYKKVLFISTSAFPVFQYKLQNPNQVSDSAFYRSLAFSDRENVYSTVKRVLRREGFTYMPPFSSSLMSFNIDDSVFVNIAEEARKSNEYDYIIIDSDCSFGNTKLAEIELADKVIIVSSYSAASLYATGKMISEINGYSRDRFMTVLNALSPGQNHELIQELSTKEDDSIDYIQNNENLTLDEMLNNQDFHRIAMQLL